LKILFLNGSRGEWGYIRPIIDFCIDYKIDYGVCATNMLLLPSHGLLLKEIRDNGYHIADEIMMSLEGHNHFSMSKSLGVFLSSFTETILREKPDWIILAGDRGEQLMGAIAASYTYTPVAHIQAGERSGNIDGVARHAIGKFVHLHFAANQDAADRLLKLGEERFRIHNVGAPQLDELVKFKILSKNNIMKKFNIPQKEFLLIVQHPVTEEMNDVTSQVEKVIKALKNFHIPKIWILPNNDAGSYSLRNAIFQKRDNDIFIFNNITRVDYLSLLKHCLAIIGNSSSGILEAPTFQTPAVNIGRRQADRLQSNNVLNADFNTIAIKKAISLAISLPFKNSLANSVNPYGDGKSSERILKVLGKTIINDKLLIKKLTY
tara:strand:- start:1315 stop:2445 length:1131 start_codon:yes stop_codon:yes gene_type:complete